MLTLFCYNYNCILLRKRFGLSQEQLAEIMDVLRKAIIKFKKVYFEKRKEAI